MAKEITTEQIEMLEEMVARARKAAAIIETYDQDRVDHLCQAVAAALYLSLIHILLYSPCHPVLVLL